MKWTSHPIYIYIHLSSTRALVKCFSGLQKKWKSQEAGTLSRINTFHEVNIPIKSVHMTTVGWLSQDLPLQRGGKLTVWVDNACAPSQFFEYIIRYVNKPLSLLFPSSDVSTFVCLSIQISLRLSPTKMPSPQKSQGSSRGRKFML